MPSLKGLCFLQSYLKFRINFLIFKDFLFTGIDIDVSVTVFPTILILIVVFGSYFIYSRARSEK